jgi:hypothetical protein
MSALPARAPQDDGQRAGRVAAAEWARLQAAAPQVVLTIHRYLRQLGTFLAPGSVTAAESALRQFALGAPRYRRRGKPSRARSQDNPA